MTINMRKLFEIVSADESLMHKIVKISELDVENAKVALTIFAGEYGVTLTEADFIPARLPACEVSDEELETIAGGVGAGENEYELKYGCVGMGFGNFLEDQGGKYLCFGAGEGIRFAN